MCHVNYLELLSCAVLTFFLRPAGGSGDAASRVHLSVHTEGEVSGSAGGGEEAAGRLHQRERRALQPAQGTREAAEACRYSAQQHLNTVKLYISNPVLS